MKLEWEFLREEVLVGILIKGRSKCGDFFFKFKSELVSPSYENLAVRRHAMVNLLKSFRLLELGYRVQGNGVVVRVSSSGILVPGC